MGMQSKTFEKEEKVVVNQVANQGVSMEEIAKVRAKYGEDFDQNRGCFDSFKKRIENLSKDKKERRRNKEWTS